MTIVVTFEDRDGGTEEHKGPSYLNTYRRAYNPRMVDPIKTEARN
jgi:hypothetical protein